MSMSSFRAAACAILGHRWCGYEVDEVIRCRWHCTRCGRVEEWRVSEGFQVGWAGDPDTRSPGAHGHAKEAR